MTNINKPTVADLIHKDMKLSSLPDIYIRASEVLDDSHSTNEQIAAIVHIDPVISARLLKVANSSFFGFQHNIANISQAASILGRAALRNMILGAVISGVTSRISKDVFPIDQYWSHSVRTAVMAKLLANDIKGLDAEAIFIVGLLHNIGKVVIAHELPYESMSIQRHIESDQVHAHTAELGILGFDHAEVGAALIKYWQLPEMFTYATRFHCDPLDADKYKKEALIISIASTLSHEKTFEDHDGVEQVIEAHPHWLDSGLNKQQIIDIYNELESHYQLAIAIL